MKIKIGGKVPYLCSVNSTLNRDWELGPFVYLPQGGKNSFIRKATAVGHVRPSRRNFVQINEKIVGEKAGKETHTDIIYLYEV